jgi:hypothetical protein
MKVDTVQLRPGVDSLQFKAVWVNSGTTPAINAFQAFSAEPINHEPTEQEFQDLKTAHPRFGSIAIAPKGTYVSDSVFVPKEDLMGSIFVQLPNGQMSTPRGMSFWGWTVYRDIFEKTPFTLLNFANRLKALRPRPAAKPS